MGMNDTPVGNRIHIAFFGCRNAGKSSLVNAITNQQLSVVSDVAGTTTDPVYKTMELLPLGPVVIIDTPGYDDEGELGKLRIDRTKAILKKTDIAILVVDLLSGITSYDLELIDLFRNKNIKYLIAYNKCDLDNHLVENQRNGDGIFDRCEGAEIIYVSALTGKNIHELKEAIAKLVPDTFAGKHIVADLVKPLDTVILVVPIDKAAPKGRLILPQQMVIRELLDANAIAIVVKETELHETLEKLSYKVDLVVTDSQAFAYVAEIVPKNIRLTSFSILMARFKGQLREAVMGAKQLDRLVEGDRILISEGCTHHRQCEDIGTVKLPGWINEYVGSTLCFDFTSGGDFPDDLSGYKLVVHCGGCMLNEREMSSRYDIARRQQIPMTNYGVLIAYINKITDVEWLYGMYNEEV